jgi:hypothetical protein
MQTKQGLDRCEMKIRIKDSTLNIFTANEVNQQISLKKAGKFACFYFFHQFESFADRLIIVCLL